jgi:hypothetical protein
MRIRKNLVDESEMAEHPEESGGYQKFRKLIRKL